VDGIGETIDLIVRIANSVQVTKLSRVSLIDSLNCTRHVENADQPYIANSTLLDFDMGQNEVSSVYQKALTAKHEHSWVSLLRGIRVEPKTVRDHRPMNASGCNKGNPRGNRYLQQKHCRKQPKKTELIAK
jgi:hypothetical protein